MSDVQQSDNLEVLSPAKKAKLSNENNGNNTQSTLKLSEFKPITILSNNSNRKLVCVLGKFNSNDSDALVILEKNAFKLDDLNDKGYFSDDNKLKVLFQNDIYGNFECYPRQELNAVKTNIIYPATQKHIDKYSQRELHLVNETPELYQQLTLPHIQKEQFDLQWVYNILDGKSEQDRIVYDNPEPESGLVILPDLKWNGVNKETLYLLAICRRRGIRSLRDLNGEHLTLLRNIRDQGKKVIEEKYNILDSQLRIYVHYQPSFYHFHVHLTYLKYEAPGITAERSHLLDTVINNIEMMPDYYQKAVLPFTVSENAKLFEIYEKNNVLKRILNMEDKNPIIDK